jgi:putative DNA primase/helicase
MFGSIIGAGCTVRPKQKDNWTEVPNLWGAIVARPGRLKTPALNQTFRPLRGLEDIAEQEHRAEMQAYIQRDTANKIAAEIAKGKAKSAPVTMPEHERSTHLREVADGAREARRRRGFTFDG